MAALAQDSLLGDRYRLSRRIAVGGMGEVWQAEDSVLHRTVAVKVLKSELTSDPKFLERFRTEARTTAALSHPGIANVFDYGEAALDSYGGPQTAYLVMEFVDGEPLSAILARTGRLPVRQTLDIIGQAAAALDVAHRARMVHRDVKPGNLLVRPDGMVKITDFGIARAADAVPLTQSGMVVGTAQYFSPEQAEGRIVTAASDVYSLGVVGYECLAGRLPFLADSAVAVAMMQIRQTPPPLPPDIPAPARALIARAMAKDPRSRFATGGELARAVRAVQQGRYEDPLPAPTPLAPPAPTARIGPGAAPATGLPAGVGPGAAAGPRAGVKPGGGVGPGTTHGSGAAPAAGIPAGGGPPSGTSGNQPVPGSPAPPGAAARPPASHGPAPPSQGIPVPGPAPVGYRTGPYQGGAPHGYPSGIGIPLPPGGPFPEAPPHGAGRWGLVAAALIVLALIVAGGVLALVLRPGNGSGTAPGGGNRPTSTLTPIRVDESEYIGGNVTDVVNRLQSLHLSPVIQVAPADQPGRPGQVVDLRWQGELTQGSEIIVIAIPNQGRGKNK